MGQGVILAVIVAPSGPLFADRADRPCARCGGEVPPRRWRRSTHGSIPLPEWCSDDCRDRAADDAAANRSRLRSNERRRNPRHLRPPRAKPTLLGQLGMFLLPSLAATSGGPICPRCGGKDGLTADGEIMNCRRCCESWRRPLITARLT